MENLSIGLETVKARAVFSIEAIPDIWEFDARVNWLVDGLIPEGAITLVSGDSGVGKSTFVLALAGAVANGQPFLGLNSIPRRVLIMDKENGLPVTRERIERLVVRTDQLTYWGTWVDPPPTGARDVSLRAYASQHKPLIVFDSLVAFHTGSEQDATETRRYMQGFRDLASLGATVIVICHTGKSEHSKQYRGSSDIRASVDRAFLLEAVGDTGGGITTLKLSTFKERMAAQFEPIQIELKDDAFTRAGPVTGAARGRAEKLVTALVADNPGQSQTSLVELASKAGIGKEQTRGVLEEGEQSGRFTVVNGSRKSKLYSVAPPGG